MKPGNGGMGIPGGGGGGDDERDGLKLGAPGGANPGGGGGGGRFGGKKDIFGGGPRGKGGGNGGADFHTLRDLFRIVTAMSAHLRLASLEVEGLPAAESHRRYPLPNLRLPGLQLHQEVGLQA